MTTQQKAQAYARKLGYTGKLPYLKKWHGGDVFSIPNPQGVDFGQPQVVVVYTNGTIEILTRSEVM